MMNYRVRHGIHIAIVSLVIFLLVKPFDCFGSGQFTPKAADCCKKGKCVPSANADDCCKGTLPGGKQLVVSKASHHAAPTINVATNATDRIIRPTSTVAAPIEGPAPPGSPPSSHLNLPLVI